MEDLKAELDRGAKEAKNLLSFLESGSAAQREDQFPYFISDLDIGPIIEKSELALPEFATLELGLATVIRETIEDFRDYLDDNTRRRPHNLLMFAQPGTGKSHFVHCLGKYLQIPQVTGNLSSPDALSVLTYVINEARNFKAQDIVPLLFLDEVEKRYADLLQVLWDGELFISGQIMKLGRCIIICAASDPKLKGYLEPKELEVAADLNSNKWPDFFSRFDAGVLRIDSINSEERTLDKLCIVAKLVKRRFPKVQYISLGLLQFLSQIKVKYEVRSLEFLINLIPANSMFALPVDLRSKLNINSNSAFLSLSRKYNDTFRAEFERLFNGKEESFNPLRFHLMEKDLEKTGDLWRCFAENIGLLKL
jgi:hypothetical protein